MNLLLTNDDGIQGQGLKILTEHLSKKHKVYVLAPDRNRSAISSSITMSAPLKIAKITDNIFTCSGVPVDCVVTALRSELFPVKFDAVVSGINIGENIGTDIVYSGTAAAARQAVLYGYPGIAVSVKSVNDKWKFDSVADFVLKNLDKLISLTEPQLVNEHYWKKNSIFVNVNAISADSYKGVKLTSLSTRDYGDSVSLIKAPDNSMYSFFCGGNIQTKGMVENDYATVDDGFISVSRVFAQPIAAKNIDDISFKL